MNKKYSHPLHVFVFLVVIISAGSLGALTIMENVEDAKSAGPAFGGTITLVTPACTIIAGECSCTLCVDSCVGTTEVQFAPAPGSTINFICILPATQIQGGYPAPGMQILGEGTSVAQIQIGVGP
jgi:hypothetical protein